LLGGRWQVVSWNKQEMSLHLYIPGLSRISTRINFLDTSSSTLDNASAAACSIIAPGYRKRRLKLLQKPLDHQALRIMFMIARRPDGSAALITLWGFRFPVIYGSADICHC